MQRIKQDGWFWRQIFRRDTCFLEMEVCFTCVAEPMFWTSQESVKYIRSSQARKQRFEEIIVEVGISCNKRSPLNIPAHWNSTFLMFEWSVQYTRAFKALDTQDLSYIDIPFADEWKMAYLLCKIFEPFYDATNVISGSLYPTACSG